LDIIDMTSLTRDKRSQKIIVCCHCVLNQNAKLEGIASWPGMINEVVELIQKSGAGILQMACPEMLYEGIGRFDKSYEQYDCPAFRQVCREISNKTIEQIRNYQKWGYKVTGILAIDGSPSCGFNLTQSAPEWRGLVAEQNWQKVRYIKKSGILFEELDPDLQNLEIPVPVVGIPEIPELGDLKLALEKIKEILT
jgi:predicted secreted protein